MKQSLPLLPVLFLLACVQLASGQPAAPPPVGTPAAPTATPIFDGGPLIEAAIAALHRHASIAASVRFRADEFESEMVGSGDYYQEGAGIDLRIRLELRTQIAGRQSSLQQVGDPRYGGYLWTDLFWQKDAASEGSHQITKVNLRRVRRALEVRDANRGDLGAQTELAIGGLPGLLESLAARFEFGHAEKVMLGDLPAYAVSGRWRAAPPNETPPAHAPNEVFVVLARQDLFPHVVEYRRSPPASEPSAPSRSLVRLELFGVEIDKPIDNRRFVYATDSSDIADTTDRFLQEHGLVDPSQP